MKRNTTISLLVAVATLAAYGINAWGAEPFLSYRWTAPPAGSDIAFYEVERDSSGVIFALVVVPDTTWSMPYPEEAFTNRLRVRGVDLAGRRGGFSVWSDTWSDAGPPGVVGEIQATIEFR